MTGRSWVGIGADGDARRLLALLGATAALAATAMAGPASEQADAASYKRCSDVVLRTGDGSVYTQTQGLWAKRASCRTARRVARSYMQGAEGNAGAAPRPLGYRCAGGADGVACKKGRKRITWGYYID